MPRQLPAAGAFFRVTLLSGECRMNKKDGRAIPHAVWEEIRKRQFVERQAGRLKPFPLRSHSPALNPDASVWNLIKRSASGLIPIESKDAMRRPVRSALPKLQRSTQPPKRLFHDEHVA